jgi:hypothetical protein
VNRRLFTLADALVATVKFVDRGAAHTLHNSHRGGTTLN